MFRCFLTYVNFNAPESIPEKYRTEVGRIVGLQPVLTQVRWYSKLTEKRPAGLFLLTSLPSKPFTAQPFVHGSYSRLQKAITSVNTTFPDTALSTTSVRNEWAAFCLNAPESDDVNEYTRAKGLKCPLGEVLLGLEDLSGLADPNPLSRSFAASKMLTSLAGDSVHWSHNMQPEPVRIWEETSGRPEYDIVVDAEMLSKFSVVELRDRIDRINVQYGFKLSKATKKDSLVKTLKASYMLISEMAKVDGASQDRSAIDNGKAAEAAANQAIAISVLAEEGTQPETAAATASGVDVVESNKKRKRTAKNSKETLLAKIYAHNQSINNGESEFAGKNLIKSFSSLSYEKLVKKLQAEGADHLVPSGESCG